MPPLIHLFLGLALGGLGGLLFLRGRAGEVAARLRLREERLAEVEAALAAKDAEARQAQLENAGLKTLLEQERKVSAEKLQAFEAAQRQLTDSFKALSGDALAANNRSFLELAKATLEKFQEGAKSDLDKRQVSIQELVKPVRESLDKFEGKIQEIEKTRVGAYEGLRQHLESMGVVQERLRLEASNLVKALRAPATRGRWGEIQLQRVVEMAGMLEHCDFVQQSSVQGDAGRLRPDLIVKLPSGKSIVVDAKAPLASYIDAIEAPTDELRLLKLQDHARQIRDHVMALSRKSYWEQFSPSPEFVVLFLPGENFYGAALEHDPSLIEAGVKNRVLIATPTTLIALLQAVAYGWRQESLAENAREISAVGAELFKRLGTMASHWNNIGKHLGQSVEAYNDATASLSSRVLVTARKLKELDAAHGADELPAAKPVAQTISTRRLEAPDELSLEDKPSAK